MEDRKLLDCLICVKILQNCAFLLNFPIKGAMLCSVALFFTFTKVLYKQSTLLKFCVYFSLM